MDNASSYEHDHRRLQTQTRRVSSASDAVSLIVEASGVASASSGLPDDNLGADWRRSFHFNCQKIKFFFDITEVL